MTLDGIIAVTNKRNSYKKSEVSSVEYNCTQTAILLTMLTLRWIEQAKDAGLYTDA